MDTARTTRVLVVANSTAATPRLLEHVRRRAKAAPCDFTLIIPGAHGGNTANWTPETALRLLKRAARGRAEAAPQGPSPFRSIQSVVRDGNYDEIIVSIRPPRWSKWLRCDLLHRIERLGLPVTAILPRGRKLSNKEAGKMMLELGGSGPFG
jgi:hypothetical protein